MTVTYLRGCVSCDCRGIKFKCIERHHKIVLHGRQQVYFFKVTSYVDSERSCYVQFSLTIFIAYRAWRQCRKSCIIYPIVPFPVTLSDPLPRFQGHGVIFRPTDALNVLSAQLTRDLFAIAKFLLARVKALWQTAVVWKHRELCMWSIVLVTSNNDYEIIWISALCKPTIKLSRMLHWRSGLVVMRWLRST